MILVLLNIIIRRIRFTRRWLISLFLILIAVLTSLQVFPQIETEFTTSTNNIGCGPLFVEFQDLSSGNPNAWLWDFGNGDTSHQQNPTYIYQIAGTYNVTLITSNNNFSDTIIKTNFIKVLEYPRSDFNIEYNCDNPLAINFTNTSTGYDSVFWDLGNGGVSNQINLQYLYPSRGTYMVKLYTVNETTGCVDEYIDLAEVKIPIADFDYLVNSNNGYEDSVGCVPHKVYLDNLSQDYSYYKIEWSDGYTGHGRVDHEFINPGLFSVKMIVTDIHGCKDTMEYEDMFKINDIEADFDVFNQVDCQTIDFINLSSSTNILWDFGDNNTSNINNPQHIYTTNGIYDVTLYVESEERCRDTLIKTNYLNIILPKSQFSTTSLSYCPEDSVEFINSSTGQGLSYSWDFNDLSNSSDIDPIYSFNNHGHYNVKLTVNDSLGCVDSFSIPIYIHESPIADVIIENRCVGSAVIFKDNSTIGTENISIYNIDYGDGVMIESYNSIQVHEYQTAGNYDVNYIIQSNHGCKDTIIKNIDIYAKPEMNIKSDQYCFGDSTLFFTNSQDQNNIQEFYWDFGDKMGSSYSSNPYYIFQDTGLHIVTLFITSVNNCMNTKQDTININPLPDVNFVLDSIACIDEPINIEYVEGDHENILIREWNFGNGTIKENKEHIYSTAGIYDIALKLVSEEGCTNTSLPQEIKISDIPQVNFYSNNNPTTLLDAEIKFFNQSEDISTLMWDFNNGIVSYEENPIITFTDTGKYNINLMVKNDYGCENNLTKTITIKPDISVFIPNSFSPNNDGVNDIFNVKASGIEMFNMKVFDRWGKIIFESNNIDDGWNGDITNYSDQSNIYIYFIELYDYNNKRWVYNGEIKLIR